jgi:hypothetical protein
MAEKSISAGGVVVGPGGLVAIEELGTYERYKISKDGKGEEKSVIKVITIFLYKTEQVELRPRDPANPEARWVKPDEVTVLLTNSKDKEFYLSVLSQVQDFIASDLLK